MAMATAMQLHRVTPSEAPNSWNFNFSVINNARFLKESYALRYEVYCKERQFLTPDNYPAKLEMDTYDKHAIHFGGIDRHGLMIGTVRLVLHSSLGFPLFKHCQLYPEYQYLTDETAQLTSAEVSRLAISKSYRRRQNDGFYDLECKGDNVTVLEEHRSSVRSIGEAPQRRHKPEIILGIYKTMYQASKRQGITHWFAAMEKSLLRLLRRYNVAFKPIGPELDYYGPVVPYVVALSEIEAGLFRKCPHILADFVDGLEPELVPAYARDL